MESDTRRAVLLGYARGQARMIELRFRIFKDPVAATTHFLGFLAAMVGVVYLIALSAGDAPKALGNAAFGVGLLAVFLTSSCYHFFDCGPRINHWLRRFDHAAIFLLIGGTYVPVVIHTMSGTWRDVTLAVIGAIGLAGVLFKLVWFNKAPPWVSLALYMGYGWLALIPAPQIFPQLSTESLAWLWCGGLAYTLGAVVYGLRRPDPWRHFGHHEIWHCFVLAGAGAHYVVAFQLLDAPYAPF